ncbi:MAG: transposase, partial [Nocardioidaceae bacterium]|nr:transposase [Nocardioidaceae bacterium]
VVDALRQAGLTVFVIPPGQLKNLRSRYGSAGNNGLCNRSSTDAPSPLIAS